MKEETVIQSAVTPAIKIVVMSEDAAGNTTSVVWKLCMDYRAIAKCEAATGRDLKRIECWKDISSGKEFPQIVHAGLNRYNPDVTLDQVIDMLNPQAQRLLSDAIFDMLFPGVKELWEKRQAEETEGGATAVPNAQAASPSA